MPKRRTRIASSAAQGELAEALRALRASAEPAPFSEEVIAEATGTEPAEPALDLRDIPFVTMDPPDAKDLDQAFHLAERGSGFTVRYAIADVPAFVRPGSALDLAARERGQALYTVDGSIPLHPRELSEQRASLLPDADRPALVWTFELDSAGAVSAFALERAMVRSRAQLDYTSVQSALDAGRDSPASLLPRIGRLRQAQEAARGGASLNLPDEQVVRSSHGNYTIERRQALPVEDWNAQLSLMTGMAAAELMVEAKVGVLRTMPEPDDRAFAVFRKATAALGREWKSGTYGDYLRTLPRDDDTTLPILLAAAKLFRGAGYVAFDGELPGEITQAAIAAPYTHATAPLRRLVDRWSLVICSALVAGEPVPQWVRESLPELPELMRQSGQRATQLETATVDTVEAALLSPLVGSRVEATVIALRSDSRSAATPAASAADGGVDARGRGSDSKPAPDRAGQPVAPGDSANSKPKPRGRETTHDQSHQGQSHQGQSHQGQSNQGWAVVKIAEPAVSALASVGDRTQPGDQVTVQVESADIATGSVRLSESD